MLAALASNVNKTAYAATRQAGGFEGCKPSMILFSRGVSAAAAAAHAARRGFRGGQASPNPTTA
jgi:hypothetical protein